MEADKTAVFDGWTTQVHGVNSGDHCTRIEPRYAYRAINATFRGGNITTRPGFLNHDLTFESDSDRERFEKGKFQGCAFYRTHRNRYILAVMSGYLFSINPEGWVVISLSNYVDVGDPNIDRWQFQQVDQWMVIQDNTNLPIIVDGVSARRADPFKFSTYSVLDADGDGNPILFAQGEIPAAYYMAYGQGRLFWARKGSNEFNAGDIMLGGDPENVLLNTEKEYLAEGGSFKLPAELGAITGMTFLQLLDTSLGVGPLLVMAEFGIATFDVSLNRNNWGDQQIGRIIYQGPAAVNPECMAHVNNEVYFVARDGIRNVHQSRADFNTMIDTPLSREISIDFEKTTPWMLKFTDSMVFDKRVFWMNQPQQHIYKDGLFDVHHRGLLAMDYDFSSQLRDTVKPTYEGVWTGLKFLGLVNGLFNDEERGFAFAWENGKIRLKEFSKHAHSDEGTRIPMRIYTRGFVFHYEDRSKRTQSGPHNLKKLSHLDLWLADMKDAVSIAVHFASDDSPMWYPISDPWETEANYTSLAAINGVLPNVAGRPHSEFQTCAAPDTEDAVQCKNRNSGYYFQLRIDLTGHASIRNGRVKAIMHHGERVGGGEQSVPSERLDIAPTDDYTYNTDD